MSGITHDDKVRFIKRLFPKAIYNMAEISQVFGHKNKKGETTTDVVEYWFLVYSVPTFKITGTPFVTQESIINMLLQADKKKSNADRMCGLEFVIEDMKFIPGGHK